MPIKIRENFQNKLRPIGHQPEHPAQAEQDTLTPVLVPLPNLRSEIKITVWLDGWLDA